MSGEFTNLVIVGGGTAGWLSACILAARRPELAITLIEAPDILTAWKMQNDGQPYAEAVSPQAAICNRDLAPRQRTMPPFAGALNYGYHLDAGKFGALLASHAVKRLGVRHVHGKVTRCLLYTSPSPRDS